jgi:hypothetical protein
VRQSFRPVPGARCGNRVAETFSKTVIAGRYAPRVRRGHLDNGWTLLSELTGIERGKRADRPELEEALQLCASALYLVGGRLE